MKRGRDNSVKCFTQITLIISNSAQKTYPNHSKKAQASSPEPKPDLAIIKDIQRQIRRQYTPEVKIRIGLEGWQGEPSVDESGRRVGLSTTIYSPLYLL
ncbi:hypothetical protein GCM10027592_26400 [Spirosoma flavus]